MKDEELVHFIIVFFALGLIFNVYYPRVFNLVLLATSLVGASYFVLGVISRVLSGLFGTNVAWAKDWWHGLAVLLMVFLIFRRPDLAIGSVMWLVQLILGGFASLASLVT